MSIRTGVAGAVTAMALSACGGGGGGGEGMGFAAAGASGVTPASAVADAQTLIDNQTGPTRLPSGRATFNGISFWVRTTANEALSTPEDELGDRLVNDPDVVSDVTLTADFDNNIVTGGRMDNFRQPNGGSASGTVNIGSSQIVDTGFGPEFTTPLSGSVTIGGARVSGPGEVEGAFIGANAEQVLGAGGLGNATSGNSPLLLGGFIAER